ncbi:MAG TPA: POTRA domain-containing protein [Caulobacteraceae bacterium]
MKGLGLLAALSLIPSAAWAAGENPPLSNTVDPTAVLPQAHSTSSPIATPERQTEAPTETPGDRQLQFVLVEARFDGAHAVSQATLRPAWSAFAGKSVSLGDLRTIAKSAEALYADAGYPFVAVVVSPQTVEGGIVHFRAVEGRISSVTVLAKSATARRQATAAFAPLVGRSPLPANAVDAAYQNAKAVPGLAVAGALRRATEPGGMDLVLQATRDTWRTYVNVNNLYPDTTGPWGALLGIDHFGGSTYGDETSLQLYSSLDGGRQTVVRLSQMQRLNASGTSISLMGLGAWASPKGSVTPLDIATNVLSARLDLSQPLIERSNLSLTADGAFEYNDQKTKVFKTVGLSDDRLRTFSASLSGAWRPSFGGDASFSVEIRKGVDILAASDPGDASLSRFGADPQALVERFSLQGETPTFHYLRVALRGEGQYTDTALTAPDEYAVGNLSIGRGYDPGAAFGDQALAGSAELRAGPITVANRVHLEPFIFYDAARLWMLTPGDHTRRDLTSYGGGLRLDVTGKLHVELLYAQPQRPPLGPGNPTPHGRVLLNVTFGLNDLISAVYRRGSEGVGAR